MAYLEIENPMVKDNFWLKFERYEQKVVGECAGCKEEILEDEEVYEIDGELVHQDAICCRDYVAELGICKLAGE